MEVAKEDIQLHVRLIGIMSLLDTAGRDRTPRGAKARGLIALLALAPDRRRPRRWIEARLWSDRGPDQASGSLRQTLVELRAALGPLADCLVTDRETVGFVGLASDLDGTPGAARAAQESGRELLEGIDVRDPAFVAWLAEQRARLAGPPSLPAMVSPPDQTAVPMLITLGMIPGGYAGFLPLALAEAIGKLVSDFARVDVFGPKGAAVTIGPQDRGLALTVDATEAHGRLHLVVGMYATRTGQALWSRQADLSLDQADLAATGEFPAIIFEAAEVALSAMPRLIGNDPSPLRAEVLLTQAVKEIFSHDPARLRHADTLLRDALVLNPTPRALAWRAFLRQTMVMERTEANLGLILDEADYYARRAVEGAPTNSLVLALAAQVQVMVHENADAGAALARDAVSFGPNNAFGYVAQSGAYLRIGQKQMALAAAQRSRDLASRSAFAPLMETLVALAALALGDNAVAVRHFEAARGRAPQFRAPLRHLLFLYMASGQTEKAVRVLADLRRLEPDFSLARIREDPSYPAGTLRKSGLLLLPLPE